MKRYRKSLAVKGVSFSVKSGEIYGLIGPDGSGKSSLLKAISGVMTYNSGEVKVFNQLINSEASAEKIKAKIGFMPQGLGLNLYPDLSIEENIDFFAHLRAVPQAILQSRKQKLLEMTHLSPFKTRAVKNLSGGMKQKLGLICTLIHQPKLVILDEPTTGVDPVSRRDFWLILNQLMQEEDMTAIISTAYMEEASRFNHLSLLNEGSVLSQGTVGSILHEKEGCQDLETFFIAKIDPQKTRLDTHTNTHADKVASSLGRVLIKSENLVKKFNRFTAVNQVNFEVKSGEIFGLLGANGAGKSTVIKMLTGILPPTSGSGTVAGESMNNPKSALKIQQQIGYMSQAFSLYLDLSVLENIYLFGRIYGLFGQHLEARAQWVLDMGHLQDVQHHLVSQLPMGQRQRLALGCALIHQPKVLFLDEPTSGVDPIGRQTFWDILRHLVQTTEVAILVTTHYMSEAEHCHRLGLMQAGKMIAYDTPQALKHQFKTEVGSILSLEVNLPFSALKLLREKLPNPNDFNKIELMGNTLHLVTHKPKETLNQVQPILKQAGLLLSYKILSPSLEDVFIHKVESAAEGLAG